VNIKNDKGEFDARVYSADGVATMLKASPIGDQVDEQ